MVNFEEMELDQRILNSLNSMKFLQPTEVQEVTIPLVLGGWDVTVRAKTGTGKTGAFMIPITQKILNKDGLRVLVLAPTRELAKQVSEVASSIAANTRKKVVTVYGGASINTQIDALRRKPSIVVGTPGRILDLISRHELNLSLVEHVVLDEADIMLDMGFVDDIKDILSFTPQNRQTLLFSATMPSGIVQVAKRYMKKDRKNIIIGNEEERTVETITNYYAISERRNKFGMLLAYIKHFKPEKTIIFTNTKEYANRVFSAMKREKLDAVLLHGDITQAQREAALREFKNRTSYLVATNVASRGLDIPKVSDIINFDAPEEANVYIHRVGRTARMGRDGRAFTIFTDAEEYLIPEIEDKANIRISQLGLIAEEPSEPFYRKSTRTDNGSRNFHRGKGGNGSNSHGNPRRKKTGGRSYEGYGKSYNDYM